MIIASDGTGAERDAHTVDVLLREAVELACSKPLSSLRAAGLFAILLTWVMGGDAEQERISEYWESFDEGVGLLKTWCRLSAPPTFECKRMFTKKGQPFGQNENTGKLAVRSYSSRGRGDVSGYM